MDTNPAADATNKRDPKARVLIQYRKEDFSLYLLSLAAIFVVCFLAWRALRSPPAELGKSDFPILFSAWEWGHRGAFIALSGSLVYLVICFVVRRGAARDPSFTRTVLRGGASYLSYFGALCWGARRRTLRLLAFWCVALAIERVWVTRAPGSFWTRQLPWQPIVVAQFLIPTAFRTVMLVAHLARRDHVRGVLEQSPMKRWIKGMSMWNHVVQAYVTGVICHLCLITPCVVFYAATRPTYVREAALLFGYIVWNQCERRLRFGAEMPIFFNNFYKDHANCHVSRFAFTIVHGHHHDTIPSGLAAVADSAPLESTARTLWWGWFLDSILIINFQFVWLVFRGMHNHQYIPGVFPYSRYVIAICTHHVLHHYGSLYPLGFVSRFTRDGPFYGHANDLSHGYEADNAKIRWYIDLMEKYEGLPPHARERILAGPTVLLGEAVDSVTDPIRTYSAGGA